MFQIACFEAPRGAKRHDETRRGACGGVQPRKIAAGLGSHRDRRAVSIAEMAADEDDQLLALCLCRRVVSGVINMGGHAVEPFSCSRRSSELMSPIANQDVVGCLTPRTRIRHLTGGHVLCTS